MRANVKVLRASSWAFLDSGAHLLQMALDKKAEALRMWISLSSQKSACSMLEARPSGSTA